VGSTWTAPARIIRAAPGSVNRLKPLREHAHDIGGTIAAWLSRGRLWSACRSTSARGAAASTWDRRRCGRPERRRRSAALGYEVDDLGDLPVKIQETQGPGDPRLKYLKEILEVCGALRDCVERVAASGSLPVVLGGDHSVAMGTIAGLSRHLRRTQEKLGLVWFDAHADSNTADTSPTGNIHGMPLAVALGYGDERLVGLSGEAPMVEAARASVVGLRDVDAAERATVKASGSAPSRCATSTSAGCGR
jgi:arginase family enzyme